MVPSAVVVTVPEDPEGRGRTIADVLREATARVDLEPLGIESLRPKRAMTRALILEVPGQGSAAKADVLAERLREAVCDRAKITRPVTKAEIRIVGLVESTTAAKVASAVAKVGGCGAEESQIGEIRKDRCGLFSTWARCPELVARKAAAEVTITMRWTRPRIELLRARPLQYHRWDSVRPGSGVLARVTEATCVIGAVNRAIRRGNVWHPRIARSARVRVGRQAKG